MTLGTRVIHKEKPEYGFGTVRYEEIDVLGDQRLHVSFDHLDHPLALTASELTAVPSASDDVKTGNWGNLGELRRRLACALVIAENNQTGSFLRTTVQPLPHQVALLDKILSGNRLGHLFADDVGLGKTIEAGLLISATLCGNPQARVLVICPAGLALQWQEEMDDHFSLYFEILGLNFTGETPSQWRNHWLVIAPIDRLKQGRYADMLQAIEPFDLVVCDEAHRLNAHRDRLTKNLRKTRNYTLFEDMIHARCMNFVQDGGAPRSPRMVFLSATPHQGDDLRFLFLLHLLRPELFPIDTEDTSILEPSRLQEVMTRTPKSEARDWDGAPLFKGHTVQTLDTHWCINERACSQALTVYINKAISGSQPGRQLIVALVMHTFHKIAASSWSALMHTLKSRLEMLQGNPQNFRSLLGEVGDDEEGIQSEDIERAFYDDEPEVLADLIAQVGALDVDSKWESCSELLRKLETTEPGCRVLFFTQFKQTQRVLAQRIGQLFPNAGVEIINGDVPLEERKAARYRFETESRFLVSTEAGGEGVNLQRACHIMVNYDWPWNPMRLQQRIGRLDRYGQKHVVRVFNLRVPDSWDEKIADRIEERLAIIQRTMGAVVSADIEDYREMILGEVADQIDPTRAFMAEVKQQVFDEAELDRKLKAAVASMQRWKERFGRHLQPALHDPKLRPSLGAEHLKVAYESALEGKGLKLQETRTSDRQYVAGVYHFVLPVEFRDSRMRPDRSQYVAFDRERYAEVRNQAIGRVRGQSITVGLAGFGETFTDWLFQSTLNARPHASAYSCKVPDSWRHGSGWLVIYCLRYLGQSRRLFAPDDLAAFFQATDSDRIIPVNRSDLFSLASSASPGTANSETMVSLDSFESSARSLLRDRVLARGDAPKTSPGLSLWTVIQLHS